MFRVYKKLIFFYLLHILHVFIHKTSFIFFNTSFFIYTYRRNFGDISYLKIFLFMIPSLIYHITEICCIRGKRNTRYEELEYIVFNCAFMICVSRFVDSIFLKNHFVFVILISIQNIFSAKIGVFYNYSFYEQCFNENIFRNRILLMIFEALPVYFSALVMTYVEHLNSFKPYFNLCILFYMFTGLVQCFLLLKKEKKLEMIKEESEGKYMPLFILSILCRTNEIFLYLVLTARTENISTVVFYFSIDFLFRLLPVKLPKNILCYFLKISLTTLTFYCIIDQDFFHIYLSLILFVINGFSNQMVYNASTNNVMEQAAEDFCVFGVFAVFLPFFAKKYSLKDFIFFNDLKL